MSISPYQSKKKNQTSSNSSSSQSEPDAANHGLFVPHSSPGHSGGSKLEEKVNGKFPLQHYGGETSEEISSRQSATSQSQRIGIGKRTQMVSGNHLLNFHYDTIRSHPSRTPPPPRRHQRRKPYNKDLFFQANYKFVLLDSGNYTPQSMDPDKMFDWDHIICLKYTTPFPVLCPICLDDPLCPQITSCGHIFCFPCILQYFSIGEDDSRGDVWKKCPLCFAMISSKDLYTIQIENVKQYHVGDEIEFLLLTRHKDSFRSSLKNNDGTSVDGQILDSFSKFTLTSDVELSVRQAMPDLDNWIARADSGLVDDIEKLPYVCAALEQLERRKKTWIGHQASRDTKANLNSSDLPPTVKTADAISGACDFVFGTISNSRNGKSSFSEKSIPNKVECSPQADELNTLLDHKLPSSSTSKDNKNAAVLPKCVIDRKDEGSYYFYQAADGQHLILHPLNMKCLLHHYGYCERLPNRITGKILQLEPLTQSEDVRRRYRFLSHFSLTTMIQLCEINLSDILPVEALIPFMDEIKNREKQRKRLARKEHRDKIKAEIADSQFLPVPYYPHEGAPSFSKEDFEALGSSVVASSSSPPTIGERQSFSSVARLGFAAAHDSPLSLKVDTSPDTDTNNESSITTGLRNAGTLSFANVASRAKPAEGPSVTKTNELGKKGKKPSQVLLSTAGRRRY